MAAQQPPPEARSLPDPPTDGITSLSYLPPTPHSSALLASTSWDGCIRVHDTQEMKPMLQHAMESGPLLSMAIPSSSSEYVYTGGLDGSVRKFNISESTNAIVGLHSGGTDVSAAIEGKTACPCLACLDHGFVSSDEGSVLASAGWDSAFYIWDARTTSAQAAATVKLPGKAFGMDVSPDGNRVVVATAGRRTCVIDVRMAREDHDQGTKSAEDDKDDGEIEEGEEPSTSSSATIQAKMVLDRESSLKFQTRSIQFFSDGGGLALGSIEGRVAIEFLDELGVESHGKKKYAFKCHRVGDTVYPVNAITFHPRFGTFATGGCDGTVVTWDGANKKKLTTLPKFPTSIAALAFNHDGSELAIASSYTFEEGERDHPRDEIYIREMLDHECKPKTAK